MPQVRKQARLHPATVSNYTKHIKRDISKTMKASPVTIIKIHKGVWEKALKIAGGDRQRIEVVSPEEVIVHNPGWKK